MSSSQASSSVTSNEMREFFTRQGIPVDEPASGFYMAAKIHVNDVITQCTKKWATTLSGTGFTKAQSEQVQKTAWKVISTEYDLYLQSQKSGIYHTTASEAWKYTVGNLSQDEKSFEVFRVCDSVTERVATPGPTEDA